MNILALDTATEILSLALETGTGLWYIETDSGSRHSELLMECADNLCKSAGIRPDEINMATCMKGPGSFTGLRIGFSAAKGLAMALGVPLAIAPTLDCIAHSLSIWPGIVIPAIDAKKGCFFSALYRGGELLTDYMDAPAETIAKEAKKLALSPQSPVILTGTGAEQLFPQLTAFIAPENIVVDPGSRKGKARELLQIVKKRKLYGEDVINAAPSYLRKSDAELNLL